MEAEQLKDFLELNEHENAACPKIWDTMKVVLRGKFSTISYIS